MDILPMSHLEKFKKVQLKRLNLEMSELLLVYQLHIHGLYHGHLRGVFNVFNSCFRKCCYLLCMLIADEGDFI